MELEDFILPSLIVIVALTLFALKNSILGFVILQLGSSSMAVDSLLSLIVAFLLGIAYLLIRIKGA